KHSALWQRGSFAISARCVPLGRFSTQPGKGVFSFRSMNSQKRFTARREAEWMGFPLNHDRRGFAVYLAGEDSEAEVIERMELMTGGETPLALHIISAGADLDDALRRLEKENIRLVAIDPARKSSRATRTARIRLAISSTELNPSQKRRTAR